jgi:hypothetical protein
MNLHDSEIGLARESMALSHCRFMGNATIKASVAELRNSYHAANYTQGLGVSMLTRICVACLKCLQRCDVRVMIVCQFYVFGVVLNLTTLAKIAVGLYTAASSLLVALLHFEHEAEALTQMGDQLQEQMDNATEMCPPCDCLP